jgi:hypothetical protein
MAGVAMPAVRARTPESAVKPSRAARVRFKVIVKIPSSSAASPWTAPLTY